MPGVLSIEINIPKDSPCEVMRCQVYLANILICISFLSLRQQDGDCWLIICHSNWLLCAGVCHSPILITSTGLCYTNSEDVTAAFQKKEMAPETQDYCLLYINLFSTFIYFQLFIKLFILIWIYINYSFLFTILFYLLSLS
jgi:hypothetical protein